MIHIRYAVSFFCMIICSRLLSEEAHEFIRPAKQPCPSRNQCCEKKVDIIVTTNE